MANYGTCVKCDNEYAVDKWRDINVCPMCTRAMLVSGIDSETIVPDVDYYEDYSPDDYDSVDFFEKGPRGDSLRYIDELE
ncbi:hypothetical protein JSQ81_17005 [Sporosarcina sp. Marseille-Q4063]|uniref:hypothetical protein n=1 Tax=Sporosarcina sp. Marseille-Q4063 TaxID=2810514 RepID=UPI001BAEC51F|nr:hypothetical protein [Sporosarcina sp. Marseille-Q4063]QUW21476.1 hypothetical protein JSQ81_17005 [Sporosarcina sp. Marseille-Q4063]